jgi:uncharacterized protein YlaI
MAKQKLDSTMQELRERAVQLRRQGHSYMQVYRCGGCGLRITIEQHNKLFDQAACDLCEHVTEIDGGTLLEILSGGAK